MPRLRRLDFRGAIHLIELLGRGDAPLFFDPGAPGSTLAQIPVQAPRVSAFESFLAGACEECDASLYAYAVVPDAAIMVLRVDGAPLEALMRRVCGRYGRFAGKATPNSRSGFAQRYAARIVAPEYLPHAVRRAHTLPVRAGIVTSGLTYPFGSSTDYAQQRSRRYIDTTALRHALDGRGYYGRDGYRRFMEEFDSDYIRQLFESGSQWDRRVVGAKHFVRQAHDLAAHPPAKLTRTQLENGVARLLHAASHASQPAPSTNVQRSLVVWYGLRSGTATLVEMARWYSISSASLGRSMHLHHLAEPHWFELPTARFQEYALL